MNKKTTIVSIVLIALMCGFIVPTQVRGFETGPGAPSTAFNNYGVNLDTLWIHGYANYAGELAAIEAKSTDFIDTTLTPTDYTTMQGIGGFNFTFVTQLALDQIDWNNAFLPFNNTLYKMGISEILQGGSGATSEKARFVNTWLGSGAAPCYAPNPGQIVVNSGYDWYDANTANIYTGGYSQALIDFINCGFPLTRDMITGGGTVYATWNFSAPFPIGGSPAKSYNPLHPSSPESYGWNLMDDGADTNHGGDGGITILTRTSDQRSHMGPEMQLLLGDNFTWWYNNQATGADKTRWTNALTDAGLPTTLLPRVEVKVDTVSMGQIYDPVFSFYCYECYTGGFSYGFLPSSMMDNYLTSNSPQAFGWGSYHDYNCYTNPVYDGFQALCENSSTPTLGVTYAHLAAEELMGGATYGPALYPYWVYTGYSPTEYTNYQTIPNAAYAGLGSWYSYVNGYPTPGSPGYATNSFTQGMRSPFPELPNPVSSSSYYCYIMLNEIYDTLTVSNPYNLSQLIPYIATSWSSGEWDNPGTGKMNSNFTANMREDVMWQDVPGVEDRSAFTWNGGHQLDGPLMNRVMTPLDVAFSYAYGAIGWGFTIAYDYSGTYQFDHVVINPCYENAWLGQIGHNATVDGTPWANETYINSLYGAPPSADLFPVYQATTPGQTPYYNTTYYLEHFVRFDPNVDPDQIQVYMSVLEPWLGAYYALGTVILPMDIFSNLALGSWPNNGIAPGFVPPDMTVMDLQPYSYNGATGADLMYGSGPFIMVDDAAAHSSDNMRMDSFRSGLTYGPGLVGLGPTITTSNSFFWQGVYAQGDVAIGENELESISIDGKVTFTDTIVNGYYVPMPCTYSFVYDIDTTGPGGSAHYSGTTAPAVTTVPARGTKAVSAVVANLAPHWTIGQTVIIHVDGCKTTFTNPINGHSITTDNSALDYKEYHTFGVSSDSYHGARARQDINGDGYVDISDGAQIGLWWHKFVPPAPANVDINQDGYIDIADGAQIGLYWHKYVAAQVLDYSN